MLRKKNLHSWLMELQTGIGNMKISVEKFSKG